MYYISYSVHRIDTGETSHMYSCIALRFCSSGKCLSWDFPTYHMLALLKVRHTFQLVILSPNAIATKMERSTTRSVHPANMKRGAKTFHTMRCRRSHAAKTADANVTTVW